MTSSMKEMCHIVCICCGQGFPNGMAQTARIRMVGKALVASGCRFTVLNIGGGLCPNKTSSGAVDGIHFAHLPGGTERPSNSLIRRAIYTMGTLQVATRLHSIRKVERNLCVYSWLEGRKFALFHRYLRSIHCPIVEEVNEWWPGTSQSLIRQRSMCLTQGTIAISHPIVDRLKNLPLYRPAHRILRVPVLVEPIDWWPLGRTAGTPHSESPYIMWCGNIACSIEDIQFLLRVTKVVNDSEKCRLILVGKYDGSTSEGICKMAVDFGVKESLLEFSGFVSNSGLRRLMNEATALLLPLWETERSVCRFPSKLGYYLASATPVVATSLGDLTYYLENAKSACLVAPNNVNEFAERVTFLLRNKEQAKSIGMAGRQVAIQHFSIQANKAKLTQFFKEIAS